MHRLPFPNSHFVASSPFELVHFDVWGPTPVMSIDGFHCYVLFVDHFTRLTWLYLLKSKSEIFSKFIELKAMIETQFSTKIKCLFVSTFSTQKSRFEKSQCPKPVWLRPKRNFLEKVAFRFVKRTLRMEMELRGPF